jgi:cysteine-rich repeat protein
MRCTLRNVDTNTLRSMLADAQGTMTTEALRREHTLAHIMRQVWAERTDAAQQQTVVTFTRAYAERLLACAQPAGGAVTTSLLGGTWTVPSASSSSSLAGGYPGVCVACSAGINAAALLRSNRQIRACNRSVAAERRVDCCVGCRAGFMPHPWSAEAEACVPWCAPGSALTPTTLGRCAPCAAGTFSIGGAGQCVGCTGLGFTANAYVDEKRGGCVECGVRAELVPGTATAGATCRACPVGQLVTMGRARCAACVVAGQYAPSGSGTTACARCPAGTYQERVGTGVCALCPANAFNGGTGATTCTTCAEGMRHAPNRTVCLRCPAWNATRFPYVEYYEAGCGVRCRPGVAYQRANLYAEGGCGECALVGVPIGAFQDLLVCTTARGCTNAPPNARYTGASAAVGESACPWTCDPGFFRASSSSACVPCAVGGFNATRHRYLGGGCAFTCLPRVYVDLDTGLTCATPCLDALVAYREGRLLFAHVHDYYPAVVGGRAERPRLMQGVCGADSEVLPQSEHPFLRWGRWVHALAPSTPPYTCGNALLDVGEGCDDGNKAAGDGCSPVCAVETSYYWDCDRIGLPCLPHCGWPISSSSSGASNSNSNSNSNNRRGGGGGLNLRGYVLPPCSAGGTMGGCDCEAANLTYRAVVALPAAERAAWMVARLVPCDCGGNAARTVPYEACTATNRGCRECAAGEYHDDTLSRCMRCGSDCARGFTTTTTMLMMVSGAAAACGPTVTTSALLLRRWPSLSSSLLLSNSSSSSSTAAPAVSSFFTEADAQAAMGCTACPQPEGLPKANGLQSVRYLQGCAYACHRDTTGADPSLDVFCNRAVDAATGACPPPGRCVSCELTRQTLVTGGTSPGHYPRGCLDGVGYSWQRCDDDGKPALAEWNTFTIVTGARRGCGWRCVPGSGYAWDGGCLPCFAHSAAVVAATCVSGQEVAFCNPEGTQAVCRPCRGPTPGALQAWRSDAPWFAACIADCEVPSFYYDYLASASSTTTTTNGHHHHRRAGGGGLSGAAAWHRPHVGDQRLDRRVRAVQPRGVRGRGATGGVRAAERRDV